MISRNDVVLASAVNLRKTDTFQMMSDIETTQYNMDSNQFEQKRLVSGQINKFFGNGSVNKFVPLQADAQTNLLRRCSEWDNTTNVYRDYLDMFTKWDNIIVNTGGYINRKLMSVMNITVDNITNMNATTKTAKDEISRYERLSGCWFITKIRYIIKPSSGSFTQNLQLSRIYS